MKIILALVFVSSFLSSKDTFASNINMHDHGASMNIQPVEMVNIVGNDVRLRSTIYACPFYPGFPDKLYGDVYECFTSREKLREHLSDNKMLELPDHELSQYILSLNATFDCANRSEKPSAVSYRGKMVYWFTGVLLKKTY